MTFVRVLVCRKEALVMTGAINTVNSSLGAASSFSVSSSALSSGASSSAGTAAVMFRNPQIIQDPSAGYITEYVNTTSGQIMAQTPSVIAVAYMRQGLSAESMSKPHHASKPVVTTA